MSFDPTKLANKLFEKKVNLAQIIAAEKQNAEQKRNKKNEADPVIETEESKKLAEIYNGIPDEVKELFGFDVKAPAPKTFEEFAKPILALLDQLDAEDLELLRQIEELEKAEAAAKKAAEDAQNEKEKALREASIAQVKNGSFSTSVKEEIEKLAAYPELSGYEIQQNPQADGSTEYRFVKKLEPLVPQLGLGTLLEDEDFYYQVIGFNSQGAPKMKRIDKTNGLASETILGKDLIEEYHKEGRIKIIQKLPDNFKVHDEVPAELIAYNTVRDSLLNVLNGKLSMYQKSLENLQKELNNPTLSVTHQQEIGKKAEDIQKRIDEANTEFKAKLGEYIRNNPKLIDLGVKIEEVVDEVDDGIEIVSIGDAPDNESDGIEIIEPGIEAEEKPGDYKELLRLVKFYTENPREPLVLGMGELFKKYPVLKKKLEEIEKRRFEELSKAKGFTGHATLTKEKAIEIINNVYDKELGKLGIIIEAKNDETQAEKKETNIQNAIDTIVGNDTVSLANKIIQVAAAVADFIDGLTAEDRLALAEISGDKANAIRKNKIAAEYAKAKLEGGNVKLVNAVESLLKGETFKDPEKEITVNNSAKEEVQITETTLEGTKKPQGLIDEIKRLTNAITAREYRIPASNQWAILDADGKVIDIGGRIDGVWKSSGSLALQESEAKELKHLYQVDQGMLKMLQSSFADKVVDLTARLGGIRKFGVFLESENTKSNNNALWGLFALYTDNENDIVTFFNALAKKPEKLQLVEKLIDAKFDELATKKNDSKQEASASPVKYRREDFPESQTSTRTPVTQSLLDYFAEINGIPKYSEDLNTGTYVSWLQNFDDTGYKVAEKLNSPRLAFDEIASRERFLLNAAEKTKNKEKQVAGDGLTEYMPASIETWITGATGEQVPAIGIVNDNGANTSWGIENLGNNKYAVAKVSSTNEKGIIQRPEAYTKKLFNEGNLPTTGTKLFIVKPAMLEKQSNGSFKVVEKGLVYYDVLPQKEEVKGTESKKEIETETKKTEKISASGLVKIATIAERIAKAGKKGFSPGELFGSAGLPDIQYGIVYNELKNAGIIKETKGRIVIADAYADKDAAKAAGEALKKKLEDQNNSL